MNDIVPTDLAQQIYQRRKAGATDQSVADWLTFIGYYVASDEIAGIASRYEQALDTAMAHRPSSSVSDVSAPRAAEQ